MLTYLLHFFLYCFVTHFLILLLFAGDAPVAGDGGKSPRATAAERFSATSRCMLRLDSLLVFPGIALQKLSC